MFSSSIQKDTNVKFIVADGLNDAKEALINRKLYQVLGVINISQISGWDNVRKSLHWVNAVFIDSEYLRKAQHFAFAFETTDLHNLVDFSYSLLDDEGKLITFKDNKEKIPRLNFSIQVIR